MTLNPCGEYESATRSPIQRRYRPSQARQQGLTINHPRFLQHSSTSTLMLIGVVDPPAESTVRDMIPDVGKAAFKTTNEALSDGLGRRAKR